MPRAPKQGSFIGNKPYAYDRPSSPETDTKPTTPSKPKIKKDHTSPGRRDFTGRRWTKDELMQLYEHVVKNGPKNWEGAVESRTGHQSRETWAKTLHPFLKKAILSKGV